MTDKLTKAKQYLAPGACVPIDTETTTLLIEALRQVLDQLPDTTEMMEPIGEIQIEQMERPFNAGKVVVHFYGEPPPVGTKLYAAPPNMDVVEPVAYVHLEEWLDDKLWPAVAFSKNPHEGMTPLYTAPPKREWQGLTNDEIAEAGKSTVEGKHMLPHSFARAIETKLKEKNGF